MTPHPPLLRLMVSILLILLTSCTAAPPPPADLVIAVPVGTVAATLQSVIKEYQPASGQKVRVETTAGDLYLDKAGGYLLAGRSDWDVVYLPAGSVSKWEQYHALAKVQVSPLGEVTAVPAQMDPDVLWYRYDWLREAGLEAPKTLDDLYSAAKKLNQSPGMAGLAMAAGPLEPGYDLADYEASLRDNSGDGLDEKDLLGALSLTRHLIADGAAVKDSLKWSRADVLAALRSGKAGMGILPLSQAAALLDCADPKTPSCSGDESLLHAAKVPGSMSAGSLWVFAVPFKASHPQAAQQFLSWLASPEGAKAWALNGGIPTSSKARSDLQVAGKYPYLAVLPGVEQVLLPLPERLGSDTFWNIYNEQAFRVMQGEVKPEEAAQMILNEVSRTANSRLP